MKMSNKLLYKYIHVENKYIALALELAEKLCIGKVCKENS